MTCHKAWPHYCENGCSISWREFTQLEAPDVQSKYIPTQDKIFKSPFGPFPPIATDLNVHESCFPPHQPLHEDYDLFINEVTDEPVTLHQFYNRVRSLAHVFRYNEPNPLGFARS